MEITINCITINCIDFIYMVFAFIYGAVIGSFLTVLIDRLPNKMSIVNPPSHCFTCGAPIKWYDNIPIVSYLVLRGKCRNCHTHYSALSLLIEAFTGIIYVLLYLKFRMSWLTPILMVVVSCFIVIFFIDLKHYIIPDSMMIGILFMAILSLFIKKDTHLLFQEMTIINRLLGLGVTCIIFGMIFIAEKIFKKELMGFGDIKLFGVVSLLVGYKLLFLGIFFSAVVALVVEFIILRKKNKIIPFGPYLAIGFTIVIFFGPEILNWYHSLFI